MSNMAMKYKGYEYRPAIDQERDERGIVEVEKFDHVVIGPDGSRMYFDCSPYHEPSWEEFQLWIDLGCPGKVTGNFRGLVDIQIAQNKQNQIT